MATISFKRGGRVGRPRRVGARAPAHAAARPPAPRLDHTLARRAGPTRSPVLPILRGAHLQQRRDRAERVPQARRQLGERFPFLGQVEQGGFAGGGVGEVQDELLDRRRRHRGGAGGGGGRGGGRPR